MAKKKKLTNLQRNQAYMAAAKYQVMDYLGWDEEQLFMCQLVCGELYLMTLLERMEVYDLKYFHTMRDSKVFWGWWKMQWYKRDSEWLIWLRNEWVSGVQAYERALAEYQRERQELVRQQMASLDYWMSYGNPGQLPPQPQPPKPMAQEHLEAEYTLLHNARMLAEGVTPNAMVLEWSFKRNVGHLLK